METTENALNELAKKIAELHGWIDSDTVEQWLDNLGYDGTENPEELEVEFSDAYQGEYSDEEEFTRDLLENSGYIPNDLPEWIKIDFQATWDNGLCYDYYELNGFFYRNI